MKTAYGTEIPEPTIPSFEKLKELNLHDSLEIGDIMRRYLLEILVCQPDMCPMQIDQLPESVRIWIQQAQKRYEEAFMQGNYDSSTKFTFWLQKLADEFRKKGFPVAINSREKAALALNREGIKTLKSYGGDLFDILWDVPLREKVISSDAVIMLEETLPGAFRYLQLRGVAILKDNSKE